MSFTLIAEQERIIQEYVRRDAAGLSDSHTYANPAFFFHIQERERTILEVLRQSGIGLPGKSVLDIGCGSGHILQRFLDFGAANGTGLDLMEARIQAGRERYPNLKLTAGNAAQMPYAGDSFDLVTQFMCLSSVLDSEVRAAIALEMWRVLKPGGIILCYDLRPPGPFYRLLFSLYAGGRRLFQKPEAAVAKEPTPIHLLSLREIQGLFPQAKLHVRAVSLNFHLASLAGRSHLLATALSALPFLRTHYLAIARKP